MKIRGALLREMRRPPPYAESRPIEIAELELEDPGPGEVLVRIAAAGLCHSDLSVIDGNRPRVMPMVLGHEAAAVVEALGPGVDDLAVGDHAVLVFVPSCGHCVPCAEGRPALCEPGAAANVAGTLLSGGRRLKLNGETVNHALGVSCFADHAVVSRRSLVRIEKDIPLAHAALFGCAVLTGVGAVMNTAGMPAGSTVAVVGLGGVGLAAVLGALAAGAGRVIAVDLSDDKIALARQLGATEGFNAGAPDAVAEIKDATSGGVAYAFEMAGSTKAMETAYAITRRGGTTVTAGLSPPGANAALEHVVMVGEERTVKGSYVGSCVPVRDIPRFAGLYRAGRLPVDRLLSETVRLEDLNAAFDRLATSQSVRQILTFD